MFDIGRASDWQVSRAHQLLLSKFLSYAKSDCFPDYWNDVLGESPACAIKRFADDGYIELCPLEAKVDIKFKATDLKDLLKQRGLKCSGRKSDLVTRLIEYDRSSLEELTRDVIGFQCTALGRQPAEKFKAEMDAERNQAEQDVLALLTGRDFRGAVLRMAKYEALQVFSRGMGIDWKRYNPESDLIVLKAMFDETPQLLMHIQHDLLDAFRLGAGMMHLLGSSSAKKWFDEMPETGIHLDAETSIRMLFFFGIHKRKLSDYRCADVRIVEVLGCNDEASCPQCRAIAGKRFPLSRTPELPLPSCTCTDGCRCTTVSADYM
ncbi:MAG: SAP domain-containing protein [bacterium]